MRIRSFAAVAVILLIAPALLAQSGLRGVDLPPDPVIPIPLYHTTPARRLADDLAKLKPTFVRAALPLGPVTAATALLVGTDTLFPGEINGTLGRIVYYSGIATGFVKSLLVRSGMTEREILQLFGDCDMGFVTDAGGATHCFETLGIAVRVPFQSSRSDLLRPIEVNGTSVGFVRG